MAWASLFGFALLLWAACGTVMAFGRRLWGLSTALRVHLVAATAMSFLLSAMHRLIAPEFGVVSRAAVLVGVAFMLDLLVVAPFFERSWDMFRSFIGTWAPFALMFAASLAAGALFAAGT